MTETPASLFHGQKIDHGPSDSRLTPVRCINQRERPAIRPDGDLIFTSSSLNDHFAGAVKPGHERYELWRLPLSASPGAKK
ncbi:hypothetical protein [Enterobacter bugandensis]|uniref:hypothetical protein n=1 Tax=Enterobacter bugandensis TaxID=881260 RepID=UPI00300D89A3